MAQADRTPIDRDIVVRAALDEIDAGGLEHFSVRNVARRLGVYPRAVHWHVGSRDDLLAAVADEVLSTITLQDDTDHWQAGIRDIAHQYRNAVGRHPNVASIIAGRITTRVDMYLPIVERLLAHLTAAGLHDAALATSYNAIIGAVTGFVALELAPAPSDDPSWSTKLRHDLENIDPLTHPVIAANWQHLAGTAFALRWDTVSDHRFDASFDRLLEMLLAVLSER